MITVSWTRLYSVMLFDQNSFLISFRGVVKIWKPKVTPLSELRPKEMKLGADGSAGDEVYIQKTSLAADKAVGALPL